MNKTIRELSIKHKAELAILIARGIVKDQTWQKWAEKWLNGSDRTRIGACILVSDIHGAMVCNIAGHAVMASSAIYGAQLATKSFNILALTSFEKTIKDSKAEIDRLLFDLIRDASHNGVDIQKCLELVGK